MIFLRYIFIVCSCLYVNHMQSAEAYYTWSKSTLAQASNELVGSVSATVERVVTEVVEKKAKRRKAEVPVENVKDKRERNRIAAQALRDKKIKQEKELEEKAVLVERERLRLDGQVKGLKIEQRDLKLAFLEEITKIAMSDNIRAVLQEEEGRNFLKQIDGWRAATIASSLSE